MSKHSQVWVFAYDIVGNRTRSQVANLLESRAVRVQRSVFEARMTKDEARRLTKRLAAFIERGDSLRVYAIANLSLSDCFTCGGPPIAEQHDFLLF